MKDKGKSIVVDMEEEKEEDPDEQWSDEESESDSREIVLALPTLSVRNDEEEEKARLNEQAVTAAELIMAAVEEAVTKKKRTRRKTRSVKEITSSSQMPKKEGVGLTNPLEGPSVCNTAEEEARLNEQAVIGAQLLLAAASEAAMTEKSDGKKKSKTRSHSDWSPRGEAKKAKKKGPELSNPPPGPPACNICGKRFGSWKAVFGHLRCHKDRNYQGFNPPPTFSSSTAPETFSIPGPNSAFRLVTVGGGRSVGLTTREGSSAIAHASGGGDTPRDSEIDLNMNPLEEVDESEGVAKFDLNKSPPTEDEDEDE